MVVCVTLGVLGLIIIKIFLSLTVNIEVSDGLFSILPIVAYSRIFPKTPITQFLNDWKITPTSHLRNGVKLYFADSEGRQVKASRSGSRETNFEYDLESRPKNKSTLWVELSTIIIQVLCSVPLLIRGRLTTLNYVGLNSPKSFS